MAAALAHLVFEEAAGVGVGDHHGGDVRPELCLQGRKIDAAACRRRHGVDGVADERGGRGVGAVRGFGHQDAAADFAARFDGRLDRHEAAEFAMRAGLGREGDRRHAGEGLQPVRETVDQRPGALNRLLRLERMDVAEAGKARDLLVEAWVVLHRARTEREEAGVDRIVLLAEADEVADDFGFRQLRQADLALAAHAAEAVGDVPRLGQIDAPFAGTAAIEAEAFFLHQAAMAGIGDDGVRAGGDRVGRATLVVHAHASTSFSAAAKAARHSSVFTSVAATMRRPSSSFSPG